MARIPVFPSFWPIGTPPPAAQNPIAVTSILDAGGAVPVASSSKPRYQAKQRRPVPTHDHITFEAGPSTGNLVVQQWDPTCRYGVPGGKKRRKPMPTTGNPEATQKRGKRSGRSVASGINTGANSVVEAGK